MVPGYRVRSLGDRGQPQDQPGGRPVSTEDTPPEVDHERLAADRARTIGLSAMVVAVVAFSTSSPLIKWAESTGSVIAFWRMVGAVLAWWTVLVVLHLVSGRPFPSARTWTLSIAPGLFFGANIALFFTAVNKTAIAHAEFIAAMSPLVLLPAGALLFDEHPNWRALRWGLLSVAGVVLVLFFGTAQGAATLGGDLLMIAVVACWVCYLLTSKRARSAGVGTIDFMSCMMPVGLLTAGPIALLIAGSDVVALSGRGWLVVAILVVMTGMLSHACIVFAQKQIPVATIGVMQTAQPALAVFFAFVFLDEAVRAPQVVGMLLVIAGLAMFTWSSQRRAAIPTPVTPVEAV
jgi:drug/metabolite transporter (DMT)-like permease